MQLIKGSKLKLLPENPYTAGNMFPPEDYDVAFSYHARKHVRSKKMTQLSCGFSDNYMTSYYSLQGLFMYVVNMEYYGHLMSPDNYDTSRAVPDLYELFHNQNDWEQYYLHDQFYSQSVNQSYSLPEVLYSRFIVEIGGLSDLVAYEWPWPVLALHWCLLVPDIQR